LLTEQQTAKATVFAPQPSSPPIYYMNLS